MNTIAVVVAMQSEFDMVMNILDKPGFVNLNGFHAVEGKKGITLTEELKIDSWED